MINPRHRLFYISMLAGAAAGGITFLVAQDWAVTIGAVVFFLFYLALALRRLPTFTAKHLRTAAADADVPMGAIFGVTALIVGVCIVSLFQVINAPDGRGGLQLGLSIGAVLLSWFVVHTMATYHYAYEFYEGNGGEGISGGLDFPGGDDPDGFAFLYFAYVIGMTAQVADVAITTNKMRRLVLVHSVFSFFFNTIIVAATVNVVVSIGSG
ncbi:DUF1345 domain-containing protein [Devosia aquimaris]|uniref:DUF1345 domain-containing protein n=1 Tax=Devosia aquimaris TaxID=2866214 RepID=UPI001CD16E4C|nr:DUF1345 domain-containing protein [Devosia sp. CJK-A8-3]